MLLAILAAVTCLLAAFLQFAVHRTPDVEDPVMQGCARKITVAALAVAGLYILYMVIHTEEGPSNVFTLFAGLIALGQLLFAAENLFEFPDIPPKKEDDHGTLT
jgi:hypothetical protein